MKLKGLVTAAAFGVFIVACVFAVSAKNDGVICGNYSYPRSVSGLGAFAENDDGISNIYSTDITATVNGYEVESYNIGGKTAIVLEDLAKLGASVSYEDSIRTLTVDFHNFYVKGESEKTEKGDTVGVPVGNIYESDIKTYLNGCEIKAFSLGGRMAAAVEDIGNAALYGTPYSRYGAVCSWNPDERRVSLDFLVTDVAKMYEFNRILSEKNYDFLSLSSDEYAFFRRHTDEYKPIDYSSEEYAAYYSSLPEYSPCTLTVGSAAYIIGYVKIPSSHVEMYLDEGATVPKLEIQSGYSQCLNYELLCRIADKLEPYKPPREALVRYYTSEEGFYAVVRARADFDECTFLALSQGTPHGPNMLLLRIDNYGSVTNYADFFESVSLYGTKTFDYVKIDEETKTVTFSYDKYYEIDLITGNMSELR